MDAFSPDGSVVIYSLPPKVGDTLEATVTGAAAASYEWAVSADGEEWSVVETETDDTFDVTADLVGMYVKVTVTAEDGETASDVTDEPVGVYEELEILSAEQTGANTALLKFSAPVTILDTITIAKGSTEKEIASQEFADTTFTSVKVTMKDNFTTGTYTATLTPADEEVAPSSVDFEAEAATKAGRIEVKGNQFLMKNTEFEEGYCFIEGFNEFDEPINLTGLQVNVAPSDSVSFDSSTGKVTAKFADHGYAIVPLVTVFASYTAADGTILTCQKTLDVVSIGYPSEIEFGDVKIDGVVDPIVTINDLATNKYYVELNVVKDQDGNDLSAEDLNDLEEDDLLTVIPQNGSPIFFGTNANPFSTVDGKVVVYLTPADAGKRMPGPGQLMITGAGGTFTKDVQIYDNPYIEELTVDMPDLYEGEWSDEIALSAVDQYGEEINLWDFAPNLNGKTLTELWFTDQNNLTGISTKITGETNGTWEVKKDTVAKTFKVRYMPAGAEKQVATFTVVTAGLNNRVITRNIGARGEGAQIVAQNGAYALVENKTKTQNLNKLVSFKDANGKVMVRTDCYDEYPIFLGKAGITPDTIATDSTIKNKDITNWYWTVTENKMPETATAAEVAAAIGNYDADGEIGIGRNTATSLNALENNVNYHNATPSYYVTLLGKAGAKYKVLDSKAFRFTYSPAAGQVAEKYVVSAVSGTMYASKNGFTTKEVEVMAVNSSGETWKPNQGLITLKPSAPFTATGNVVSGNVGKDLGDGTVDVKVYYNGVAIDTIGIAYSDDDPVPTSTEVKLATTTRMGKDWDAATTLTSFDTPTDAVTDVKFADGTLTIENLNGFKDTLTACIKDQYGQVMTSSAVKLNGEKLKTNTYSAAALPIANFVVTNGTQKIDLELENLNSIKTTRVAEAPAVTVVTVSDEATLNKALGMASATSPVDVTLDKSITATGDITVGRYAKLTVANGAFVDMDGHDLKVDGEAVIDGALTTAKNITIDTAGGLGAKLTVNGTLSTTGGGTVTVRDSVKDQEDTLVINGIWNITGGVTDLAGAGKVTGDGHVTIGAGASLTNATWTGEWNVDGNTLEILGKLTIGGASLWKGHTVVGEGGELEVTAAGATLGGEIEFKALSKFTTTGANAPTLLNGTSLEVSKSATLTDGSVKLDTGATVTVESSDGTVTQTTAVTGTPAATLSASGIDGKTTGETEKETLASVEPSIVSFSYDGGTEKDLLAALQAGGFQYDSKPYSTSNNDFKGADKHLGWVICGGLEAGKYYAVVAETEGGQVLLTSKPSQGWTAYKATGAAYGRADYWNWSSSYKGQINIDVNPTTYKLYSLATAPTADNLKDWTVDSTDQMYHGTANLETLGWTLVGSSK